jgi:hypothetical protein
MTHEVFRVSNSPVTPKAGVEMIAAERQRQLEAEGWSPEHDAEHVRGELARAAAVYAIPPDRRDPSIWSYLWPGWEYKPNADDRIRELVKAGALIAAEIDRLTAAK